MGDDLVMQGCPFCESMGERVIDSHESMFVVRDAYPVTEGHTLIIPFSHLATWFELTESQRVDLNLLLQRHRDLLIADDPTITGFNIGMNCGVDAGQTVMHCHMHLTPRRPGDVANPRGGIRRVIPGASEYAG